MEKTMELPKEKLPEELAELLEEIWTREESGKTSDHLSELKQLRGGDASLLDELSRQQLVQVESGTRIKLLPDGRRLAEKIIRRHRLAERLICDVLGSHVDDSEDAACEFEHVLAEGIASSICTLLGHPRFCPHNKPIPEGECCRQAQEDVEPIVVSAEQLEIGKSGKIAYLCTRESTLLTKLSNLGVAPGSVLKLLQRWPTYVIQCEETEIALEEEVVRNIYVWHTP
jgi:DtxR family transcriptional regulator, Mn-dependent transcriptional regulator